MMIAGTAISAIGAIRAGQAQAAAANYNAQVAERNAFISRDQAAADEQRQRIQARRKLGAMRAAYGASGISLEGSPLDVLEDSAAEAELDALTIRYKGEIGAMGYEAEAGAQRARAQNAKTESYYNAGAALLTGASNYYMKRG